MRNPTKALLISSLWVLVLGGCQSLSSLPLFVEQIEAQPVTTPLIVENQVNKAIWSKAKPIPFRLVAIPEARKRIGKLESAGDARLWYDEKNLYVALTFEDEDIVDLSNKNGQELYTLADVGEIFLKPLDDTWYWEIHVSPQGRVSTYWWEGRGRVGLTGSRLRVEPPIVQAATWTRGILNQTKSRDNGWSALVTIPWAKIDRTGATRTPHSRWSILMSRYDYSRFRQKGTGPELSATSLFAEPSFHQVDEYPKLKLVK